MCGILGVYSSKRELRLPHFNKALRLLKHRGPDFQDAKQIDENVILGHTRLSILDLSTCSNQPFSVDDRYTLTYNGEVYNYVEIREELQTLGISFNTTGDTEVVLWAYKIWGEECVNRFNGMWAFAIYDKELKKLFCSRDRFGVKPFNYHNGDGEFIFSSEIKPIIAYRPEIKAPNYNLIANYCYKSIGAQAKETWFESIFRLPPSHNLTYQSGELKIFKYWSYPKKVDKSLTFEQAIKQFQELFLNAVKLRMRSDVKVGSTLSSGLDSSSIVGVINALYPEKIETFTAYNDTSSYTKKDKAVFKQDVDLNEASTVNLLTKKFNVTSNLVEVSFSDYLGKLSEAIYYLESGHSSPAIISIHQVYKIARKKIKVLLEGQGADELLAGYIVDSFPSYIKEILKSGGVKKAFTEFVEFKNMYSTYYLFMLYLRSFDSSFFNSIKNSVKRIDVFNKNAFKFEYVKDNWEDEDGFDQSFNKFLYKQHTSGLVNLLHYGDALSMAESIECRLPFMDYRLVEFAFSLPYNFKLDKMKGKYIQRRALSSYIPDYITNSTLKIGFATPLDTLIKDSKEIENILINQRCGDLFDENKVKKLLKKHQEGRGNYSTLLFRILSTKIWYKTFFE